jgi:hypothetical protein
MHFIQYKIQKTSHNRYMLANLIYVEYILALEQKTNGTLTSPLNQSVAIDDYANRLYSGKHAFFMLFKRKTVGTLCDEKWFWFPPLVGQYGVEKKM